MEAFSTITSSVFSELTFFLRPSHFDLLVLDRVAIETLCAMNKARPFKLVFSVRYVSPWEKQRLENVVNYVTTGGVFDFFDPPPTIRVR
jgi:hypothetical protein